MYAEIISVGNEILSGATANTNTVFLSRNLGLMGFDVHHQSVVGDNEDDIVESVKIAGARSHVVILTGGLGPTKDDMTKEAVAKAFGLTLVESPEVVEQINSFFEQRGRPTTENNYKQAMVIQGGDVLNNPNGTAPGLLLQTATQSIAMLPGPPNEMEHMFEHELKPRLEKMRSDFSAGASLHVFGIGESDLEDQVRDLLYEKNPSAALYAKPGEVYIDIIAHSHTQQAADESLEHKVEQFKSRVGENIYSDDGKSIAETVVEMLRRKKVRIAVAESCTGGLMAARITDVPGASDVFDYGVTTYTDWAKSSNLGVEKSFLRKFSAISSVAAAEMAKNVRDQGHADIGVGITGIAGPSTGDYIDKPVGLVYIAVADKSKVIVRRFNFSNMRSRQTIREQSVMNAFDMVRRMLGKMDIEDAKKFSHNQLAEVEREGPPRKRSAIKTQKAVASSILLVFMLLGAFGIFQGIRSNMNSVVYETLKEEYMAMSPDGSVAVTGFETLAFRNPDTRGWLSSEAGGLDCVVVQGRGDGYYENHDFDGNLNAMGCVYIDERVDIRTGVDNIVLYGKSDTAAYLFGPLLDFTSPNYMSEHYLINFNTIYSNDYYKVVSAFYVNTNESKGAVQDRYLSLNFNTTEAFVDFVVDIKMRSVVNAEIDIITGDRFLTMVTDVSDWDGARLVVVARQVRQGESGDVSPVLFSPNIAAAYPDEWYSKHNTKPVHNEVVERDRWTNWLIFNDQNYQTGGQSGQSAEINVSDNPYFATTKEGDLIVTVLMNGAELTDSPLNIVSRMVAFEIGNEGATEATKAQAVACATWLRYSFNTGLIPSVQGRSPTERVVGLVEEVIETGMYYDGEIAYTPYFDIASQYTYSAEDIYGTPYPYLVSVESRYDYMVVGYTRTTTFSSAVIKARIETMYNIVLSDDSKNWIKIVDYTAGGAVKNVSIDGQITVSGVELAIDCLALRSPKFTLTVYSDTIVFVNEGHGYGVGMSKSGAEQYALRNQWDYVQILNHYYPGIELSELKW